MSPASGARPRIGVTLDAEEGAGRYFLKESYVLAVEAAGGLPLLLPHAPALARDYLSAIDGLLVTGGAFDVPPELYGEAQREGLGPLRPARTRFERELLLLALGASLPVLGVCGGMQLLNVVRGGTLFQDLEKDAGKAGHEQPPPRDQPCHAVQVALGSLLFRLLGPGVPEHRVNSTHHQAVRDLGSGLIAVATAPDGVVEAVEIPGLPFAIGVQWHPEALLRHDPRQAGLYAGLVEAARSHER